MRDSFLFHTETELQDQSREHKTLIDACTSLLLNTFIALKEKF